LLEKGPTTAGQVLFLSAIRHSHSLTDSPVTKTSKGDPLERALVSFAQQNDHLLPSVLRLAEIPFDDARRRQSVVVKMNNRFWLLTKGAPEVIVDLCETALGNQAEVLPFAQRKPEVLQQADKYAESGFKVLGYACRTLDETLLNGICLSSSLADVQNPETSETPLPAPDIEHHLIFLGLLTLADPLRNEVPLAVNACRAAGLRVIMITGDHPETARYVAYHSGIFRNPHARIVTGSELEHWSDTQLQLALGIEEIGFARVHATQKLRIVQALQEKKEIVAVTGDGVNDAPALHRANVGIAMGMCGTDVARESADVILLDDNFASIVAGVHEGRGIFRNIGNFMTYILSSNVPEAVPLVFYAFLPIPLPLTIPQILAIDLGTDMVPAIGLGSETSEQPIRQRSAKGERLHILNVTLLLKAWLWLGLWQAIAAMTMFFLTLFWGGWTWGQPVEAKSLLSRQAATAAFVSVIVMQMANVFVCRGRPELFDRSALINKILISGVLIELILIPVFLYLPFAQGILGTAPLPVKFFPMISLFVLFFLFAEKIRRIVSHKFFSSSSP
jgi:magnesium-transporting ATPase (P-type)